MQITEVRIKLMEDSDDRLRAFCSITFDDCFVVRDLKIIDGNNGPFVAMPSRKLSGHCPKCRSKNHLKARYCNQCGTRIKQDQVAMDGHGRAKLYADIAHPVNPQCREMIQEHVLREFELEKDRAKQPGYVSNYDDAYDVGNRGPQRSIRIDEPQSREAGPHETRSHGQDAQSSDSQADGSAEGGKKDFGDGIF